MSISLRFTTTISAVSLWLAEHPMAVTVAGAVVPVVLALALALFTHSAAHAYPLANPLATGGGGVGDIAIRGFGK